MGVYYYFYNMTKAEVNYKPIAQNFKLPFMKNFNNYISKHKQLQIVKEIIKLNENWCDTDVIIVIPDYENYPKYIYTERDIKGKKMCNYSLIEEYNETHIILELRNLILNKMNEFMDNYTII